MGISLEERLLDELEEMLKHHDWYYQYSDDHRVWKRGNEQNRAITNKFNEIKKHSQTLFDQAELLFNKYLNDK